jgi:hypothetical protein
VKKKYDEKQRLERECESVMSYDYRLWYIWNSNSKLGGINYSQLS